MTNIKDSNIKEFKRNSGKRTDQMVLRTIKEHKMIDSIRELDKMIPDKSYGAIWKSVKRLSDSEMIIVKETFDEKAGAKKKRIFLNKEIYDKYLSKNKTKNTQNLDPNGVLQWNYQQLAREIMNNIEKKQILDELPYQIEFYRNFKNKLLYDYGPVRSAKQEIQKIITKKLKGLKFSFKKYNL